MELLNARVLKVTLSESVESFLHYYIVTRVFFVFRKTTFLLILSFLLIIYNSCIIRWLLSSHMIFPSPTQMWWWTGNSGIHSCFLEFTINTVSIAFIVVKIVVLGVSIKGVMLLLGVGVCLISEIASATTNRLSLS